jgi:hypothetical protein
MPRLIKTMNGKSCSWLRQSRKFRLPTGALLTVLAIVSLPSAHGGDIPDWLSRAAQKPLPAAMDKETNAVVLYSEDQAVVRKGGEVETLHRKVIRIFRPGGRDQGEVTVSFSTDRPLLSLKGWSIPPNGKPYEVGLKDALETSPYNYELYSDERLKVLTIPAADPGSVIGYEWTQRERPDFLEQYWSFQRPIPVEDARFTLMLPPGWEFATYWRNHPEQKPQTGTAGQYSWEVRDVPALKTEEDMPAWDVVAGSMSLSFYPITAAKGALIGHTWGDLGSWYENLTRSRRQDSPQIRAKVTELTAGASSDWERIQRLSAYVQGQIRYVAIEIGIGGYQPHPAPDVFRQGYGDCKDKASLLATMLHDANVETYMVLIDTDRGVIVPEFPNRGFNHAILAIRLADSIPAIRFNAEVHSPHLGRLLFFDPTNSYVSLGQSPSYLQANYGLVSYSGGGELIALPLAPPESNRRGRTGKFTLTSGQNLFGEVSESLTGSAGSLKRYTWQSQTAKERTKMMEDFLGRFFIHFTLNSYDLEHAGDSAADPVLRYSFEADGFARTAGDFVVVQPCVLGRYALDLMEKPEPRRFAVVFDHTGIAEDDYTISLPTGYSPDDIPDPVDLTEDFAEYHSRVTLEAGTIHYRRTLVTKKLDVPVDELLALKKFYRRISTAESASVLMRTVAP